MAAAAMKMTKLTQLSISQTHTPQGYPADPPPDTRRAPGTCPGARRSGVDQADFFAAAFLAGARLAVVFFAGAFLAAAFLAGAFFAALVTGLAVTAFTPSLRIAATNFSPRAARSA